MSIKKRSENVDLQLNGDQNIFLTVTIGNAQIGGNLVKFADSNTPLKKGKIENLNIGYAGNISGKTLRIITNILDVNEATNGVVATYYFHGASNPVSVFYDTVDSDGDIFSLTLDFHLN